MRIAGYASKSLSDLERLCVEFGHLYRPTNRGCNGTESKYLVSGEAWMYLNTPRHRQRENPR